MITREEERALWLWWNWKNYGGKKPNRKIFDIAVKTASWHKLTDEQLDDIWVRWSEVYMPQKVEKVKGVT